MNDTSGRPDAARSTILGSAHVSSSNVIGYTLITAAAMLAFFFAFQAGLLASYPTFNKELSEKTLWHVPFGKIVISLICLAAMVFNLWSYKIVRIFIVYFETFILAGKALEHESACSGVGIYTAMSATYDRPGPQSALLRVTELFFLALSAAWLVLGIVSWG